jgi:hypothetical protein
MPYAPTWTNGNAQGRLVGAVHNVRLSDAQELCDAINRRRLLTYQNRQDFSSQVHGLAFVRAATVAAQEPPPFDGFRAALCQKVLTPSAGGMGGTPPTPQAMRWIWPLSGADENKVIVSGGSGVGEGEVGLFQKLNGTNHWTDATLTAGGTSIRAAHFNELRQAAEWIRRGRWELPIYYAAGIFSPMPDTPWIGEAIANNGTQELRSLGFAVIRTGETPPRGLTDVLVRAGSFLEVTADTDCTVQVYRCLRGLEFVADPPTWNEYDPGSSLAWSAPGATGGGDSTLLGSIDLTADEPGTLSGQAVTAALQAMIDGAEQNFLLRRSDTGYQTITVTGRAVIEFDLNSPPN